MTSAWLGLLLIGFGTSGCGDDQAGNQPRTPRTTTGQTSPTASGPRALLRDADARSLSKQLRAGIAASDVETRRVAALGIARLHELDGVPLLRRALRSPDPEVRSNAALGLGALEDDAPAEAEQALIGALASETDVPTRAAMLWDLGRAGRDAAVAPLRDALAATEPEIRAGACRGIGALGLRSQAVPS